MEEKGNITLKTMNSRRKKVFYNDNVNKTLIMDLKIELLNEQEDWGTEEQEEKSNFTLCSLS